MIGSGRRSVPAGILLLLVLPVVLSVRLSALLDTILSEGYFSPNSQDSSAHNILGNITAQISQCTSTVRNLTESLRSNATQLPSIHAFPDASWTTKGPRPSNDPHDLIFAEPSGENVERARALAKRVLYRGLEWGPDHPYLPLEPRLPQYEMFVLTLHKLYLPAMLRKHSFFQRKKGLGDTWARFRRRWGIIRESDVGARDSPEPALDHEAILIAALNDAEAKLYASMAEFWQEFGPDIDDTSCEDNKNLHHHVRDYYGFYLRSFAKLDCRVRAGEPPKGEGDSPGVIPPVWNNSDFSRIGFLRTLFEPSRVNTIYPLGIQVGEKIFEILDQKNFRGGEVEEVNTDAACQVHSDPYTILNPELDYITENAGLPAPRNVLQRKDFIALSAPAETVSPSPRAVSSGEETASSPTSEKKSASAQKTSASERLFHRLLHTRLRGTQHLADAFWGPLARRGLDLAHFLKLPRASVGPRAWFWNELQDRFRRREGCHGSTILLFAITFHRFLFRDAMGLGILALWAGTLYLTLGGAESVEGYDWGFTKEDVVAATSSFVNPRSGHHFKWWVWSAVVAFLGDRPISHIIFPCRSPDASLTHLPHQSPTYLYTYLLSRRACM